MENENNTQSKSNNSIIYILLSVIVALLGYIGYIYNNYDLLQKGDLQNNYISKESIDFYSLPQTIQDQYILKSQHNIQAQQLKDHIDTLQQNITKLKNQPTKIITKEITKTIPKEIVVYKKYNSNKFDTFECDDMSDGGYYISNSSLKKLHQFLDKHKNSKYFEIIGLVDKLDFRLLRDLKGKIDNKKREKLDNFAQIGLSRKRVIEATWNIKDYLGKDTDIKVVNYTITSKKKHKGFIVRAYQ